MSTSAADVEATPTSWSNSEMKVTEFTHRWCISNVPYQNLDRLTSAVFSSPGVDQSRFHLSLSDYRTVDVRLTLLSSLEPDIQVKWKINARNSNGGLVTSKFSSNDRLTTNGRFSSMSIIDLDISRDNLICSLREGSLTLNCTIGIIHFGSTVTTSGSSIKTLTTAIATNSQEKILTDLWALFESGTLSDVTLSVGAKEFTAHKFILAARSPVFAAMFEHDMKERKENKVEISDVEVEVFELLLKYMYTGKCDALEKMAIPLMIAANMYRLDELKLSCEQVLACKMTRKLAPKLLVLADTYHALNLKEKVLKYIEQNSEMVIASMIRDKKTDQLVKLFKDFISKEEDPDDWEDLM